MWFFVVFVAVLSNLSTFLGGCAPLKNANKTRAMGAQVCLLTVNSGVYH